MHDFPVLSFSFGLSVLILLIFYSNSANIPKKMIKGVFLTYFKSDNLFMCNCLLSERVN